MDTNYHQQLLEHTGRRIRFYRRLKKLSQDELAAAIHKSESTLSKYERGTIAIDIATLCDIARVLDVSVSALVDFERPSLPRETVGNGLFGQKDTLYIYYYEKGMKNLVYGIINPDFSSADENGIPCRCYMELPESGDRELCKYYCTGNMTSYDMLTYFSLKNSTMKMGHMYIYILNPYSHNANAWGFMTGSTVGGASIYIYKVLISPERIPLSELNIADFDYDSEDLKNLKQRYSLRFNHPNKDYI